MGALSRRRFVRNGIAAGAGAAISARSWGRVLGANDAIRMAVVGFNGQGRSHISGFGKIAGVRLVALCDVDKDVLNKHAETLRSAGNEIETYTDVRELLENRNVDAISTATPNHWHALIAIWACQAGKDVYVEKPASHSVWEGRQIVAAARKYNRIVQTGTQGRSSAAWREAFAWLREGNLGKIRVSRGLCYKRRGTIGRTYEPQPVPASVDYDLWCGPAPNEPLRRKRLHYDWHWVWPTGNGDLGNQGIHQMDIARWALGTNELSPRVISVGGRLGYIDDGETPNTQFVVHDYGDSLLIFEVRGLPCRTGSEEMDKYHNQSVGNVIECEGGYLAGPTAYDKDGKEIRRFAGKGETHHENFIRAVRSRKHTDLNADILEGHLSSALCHTGNISYRLGQAAAPEEIREAIKKDSAALETFGRLQEHLSANGVDLKLNKATLGAFLKMNPRTERFVGNSRADLLLTREYRIPYVVPKIV